MRAWLLLTVLLLPTAARAQEKREDRAGWWFAGDFSLAPLGRYTRSAENPSTNIYALGGTLAVSAYYVGHGRFGFGAHVAPGLTALEPSLRGRATTADIGLDPLLRLARGKVDLTLRVPVGLTTGHLNWVRTADGLVLESNPLYGGAEFRNDDLGLGFHVGPQLGAIFWFGGLIGVRLESGFGYRRMEFDEGKLGSSRSNNLIQTIRGEVVHQSWTWTLSFGFVRRLDPNKLPDDNGPPLPTPDYFQPTR